jgi:hypothetical protein
MILRFRDDQGGWNIRLKPASRTRTLLCFGMKVIDRRRRAV